VNLSYFISKRISREQQQGFASTIHRIAVASIGIGLAASILSFLIMRGFQETVKQKVYGFNGHMVVTKFTTSNSSEERPMNYHVDPYDHPEKYPFVTHMQEFAHKPGLIKTDQDEVLGVFVKGVGKSYDVNAFRSSMVEGKFFDFPDSGYARQVVVSKIIARKLNAKVGDDLVVHFFQNPIRSRKLTISGIYETNLSEYFDSKVIIGDIRMIQKLNDWSDSLAGGLEVFVKDEGPERMEEDAFTISEAMDLDFNVQLISDKYVQVFEWLNLISRQVNILLFIILTVVCVNMISIVLILVMERTQMIGMLKAMGATDKMIRSVFLFNGINLLVKGLVLGNLLGLGLCAIQYYFKIIKLNAHDYYMSFVPISWSWEVVAVLNLVTFFVVTIVLLVPTMVIARINPIRAIRFD